MVEKPKIYGIFQMIFSAYFIWHFSKLFYLYKFTNILFTVMYPDWVIIVLILMSLFGFLIGLMVFSKKTKIRVGNLILLSILIIGFLLDYIAIS